MRSINDFVYEDVIYINNEDIYYNGYPRTRWEVRRRCADRRSTYTFDHFLAPTDATQDDVIDAYYEQAS